MIRRQPTLIALNDTDVQQARTLLETIRAAKQAHLSANQFQVQASTNSVSNSPSAANAQTPAKPLTKEERLGLR
ncbi:hypothetical protein DFH11DRAFT_1562871 [Phellopilus nigrolimitatus]|nr:hypothetical protein DFH11DRAFT_1562871 [Phellopilus nigrolimitatus]